MRILTSSEIKKAEQDAVEKGTSFEQLMENAGTRAAQLMIELAQQEHIAQSALLLCGKGNNGGDAFVIARLLHAAGWQVEYILLQPPPFSLLARRNQLRMPSLVAEKSVETGNFSSGFIVDGVFGTGFQGQLPAEVIHAFSKSRDTGAVTVALDIPSGLVCDTGRIAAGTFQARHTFTFGAMKPGLLVAGSQGYTGSVTVLDIGI